MDDTTILRQTAVSHEMGRGRSSLYTDAKSGLLTQPVRIGPNAVGWPAGEIRRLNIARIAGMADDDIRALVRELMAARKALV